MSSFNEEQIESYMRQARAEEADFDRLLDRLGPDGKKAYRDHERRMRELMAAFQTALAASDWEEAKRATLVVVQTMPVVISAGIAWKRIIADLHATEPPRIFRIPGGAP